MWCDRLLTCLFLAVLAGVPGMAGQVHAAGSGERRLTLGDCVSRAVRANLALRRERVEPAQADLEVEIEKGRFWPALFFDFGLRDERRPRNGGEVDTDTFVYNGGVDWDSRLGTGVTASLTNSRRGTTDPGAGFDPEHRSRMEIVVAQPLLKGLGVGVNTTDLREAELASRSAHQVFRGRLNALIRDVAHAYWNLVLAQEDVATKERSLQRARQQYEDTRENIRRGLLPEHDVYVVEENLVSFQKKLAEALNALSAAQAVMAERMHLAPSEGRRLVAVEQPAPAGIRPGPEEDLLAVGFTRNPALCAARARAEAAQVRFRFEQNQRLPAIDLQASLALNGVTSDPGESWEQLAAFDNREAYLGLRVDLPLFDLLDDSRVVRARLDVERRLLEIKEHEERLYFEISNLRRNILHRLESYRLALRISELARQKLEAQQVKYRAGVAALKDLVQFLRELDEAEIEKTRALVALVKQVVDLHLATGDLHDRYGVGVR